MRVFLLTPLFLSGNPWVFSLSLCLPIPDCSPIFVFVALTGVELPGQLWQLSRAGRDWGKQERKCPSLGKWRCPRLIGLPTGALRVKRAAPPWRLVAMETRKQVQPPLRGERGHAFSGRLLAQTSGVLLEGKFPLSLINLLSPFIEKKKI